MGFFASSDFYLWLKRNAWGLVFLSLCRILFVFYHFQYFNSAPWGQFHWVLLSGLLFDCQAIAYFLLPFHLLSLWPKPSPKAWYAKSQLIAYSVGFGLIILLNTIDTEFFAIKYRRSGIELFQLVGDKSNPVLAYLINYWYLLLAYLLMMGLLVWGYPRSKGNNTVTPFKNRVLIAILGSLMIGLAARGSISIKPLRSFDAAQYVDPQWVAASINSPTQLITSYSSSTPKALDYYPQSLAEQLSATHQTVEPHFKTGIKPNIVLIILESFGRDYCGFLNKENRFTPFLDSLAKSALVFEHAYSNGTTSMESLPAIFTSIPSLLEVPYINSNFQNNTLYGIHHYLKRNGYNNRFYYGAANGSMGFDNFLHISGPIDYYGKDEYPSPQSDDDGHWGIWDQPYLQYFKQALDQQAQPFFSSVFTLSSHDPYNIPDQYKNQFKGGHLPIYKAVQYTDFALSQFFKQAQKSAWFNNTIFIITADHPSHSVNEYFYTPTGKYEIPLLLYAPKLIPPGRNTSLSASHIDIMPTVLSLTGVKDSFFAFGKNLFDSTARYPINKDNGLAQLIDYPYCLRLYPNGQSQMHVQAKYTPNTKIRRLLSPQEVNKQAHLDSLLKAKLQVYYNGLLDNQFHISPR